MKALTALLAVAGIVLGIVILRSGEPTYVAPAEAAMPKVVPVSLSGEVPRGSVVRTFAVEGMCCEGCAGKLLDAVSHVDGVGEVAIDPVLGRAQVVAEETTDTEAIAAALTFDKYTATPAE